MCTDQTGNQTLTDLVHIYVASNRVIPTLQAKTLFFLLLGYLIQLKTELFWGGGGGMVSSDTWWLPVVVFSFLRVDFLGVFKISKMLSYFYFIFLTEIVL